MSDVRWWPLAAILVLAIPTPARADDTVDTAAKTVETAADAAKDAADAVGDAARSVTDRGWASQGADTLPPGAYGLVVAGGFPQVRLQFHLPVAQRLEVNPFLTFNYWDDVTDGGPVLSDVLGAQIKLNLLADGPVQVALLIEPGLYVRYHPGQVGFGFQLGFPEFVISGKVADKLVLLGGLKVPIALRFTPEFEIRVPVLAELGVEYLVDKAVTLFAVVDAGPDLIVSDRRKVAEVDRWVAYQDGQWVRYDDVVVYQRGSFLRVEFALSIVLGASFRF